VAYYNRATARFDLGDVLGEIEDYNRALRLDPDFADAYLNRGLARLRLGNRREALVDFRKAAALFAQRGDEVMHQQILDLMQKVTQK
jgi:tetratricopeptide (TPR) repeat protein